MLAAAPQLASGGLQSGQQMDPLFATTPLTADQTRSTVTTSFDYRAGTVSCTIGSAQETPVQIGSIFSSLSHALHDALHWLQHIQDEA